MRILRQHCLVLFFKDGVFTLFIKTGFSQRAEAEGNEAHPRNGDGVGTVRVGKGICVPVLFGSLLEMQGNGTVRELFNTIFAEVTGEDEGIIAAAALHHVVAAAAGKDIIPGTACETVIPGTAGKEIAFSAAPEDIVAVAAVDLDGTAFIVIADSCHIDDIVSGPGADLIDLSKTGTFTQGGIDIIHKEGITVGVIGHHQDPGIGRSFKDICDLVPAGEEDAFTGHLIFCGISFAPDAAGVGKEEIRSAVGVGVEESGFSIALCGDFAAGDTGRIRFDTPLICSLSHAVCQGR